MADYSGQKLKIVSKEECKQATTHGRPDDQPVLLDFISSKLIHSHVGCMGGLLA